MTEAKEAGRRLAVALAFRGRDAIYPGKAGDGAEAGGGAPGSTVPFIEADRDGRAVRRDEQELPDAGDNRRGSSVFEDILKWEGRLRADTVRYCSLLS